jgi:maleate isomerase
MSEAAAVQDSRIVSMESLRKLGHITPSCNSVLEPLTAMLTRTVATQLSNHYTRIPVGNISLSPEDVDQFEVQGMLAAASVLAEAPLDAIVWNGTSGAWNGTHADKELCEAITHRTGLPATTSTLAQLDLLGRHDIAKVALAVPYADDVTERIIAVYGAEGYETVSHANLGMTVGKDMANVPIANIRELIRAADSPQATAIIVVCTGLPAALIVEQLEAELGKPIFDSVAVTARRGMDLAGFEEPVPGWGAVMAGPDAVAALLDG